MVQIQNLQLLDTQTLTEATRAQRTINAKLSLQGKFFSSVNKLPAERVNQHK